MLFPLATLFAAPAALALPQAGTGGMKDGYHPVRPTIDTTPVITWPKAETDYCSCTRNIADSRGA